MRLAQPHVAIALGALVCSAYCATHTRHAPSSRVVTAESSVAVEEPAPVALPAREPNAAPAKPPAAVARAPAFDEPGLMTKIRALRLSDPEQALQLATLANIEHPSSADAAERAWIAVRSLEDLRRFHEAQNVARDMQERYSGTVWTEDVERHVLVHPLDFPSREEQQANLQQTRGYPNGL